MAFSEKQINVQFSLANGQFAGGGNTATVTGLRTACQIVATGGASQSTMELAIYGMSPSLMNQLSTIGSQVNQRSQNDITVTASDDQGGMPVVFIGTIFNAFVDGQSMPEVCFRVVASPGVFHAVKPATPISLSGGADAAQMMQNLAGQMGLSFLNGGVNVKLADPSYYGSNWDIAMQIAEHGNFDVAIDRGTMSISPRGVPLPGTAIPVGSDTGMIGYPGFVQNRIVLRTLFNPAIKLLGLIDVTSSLQPACGQWLVAKLDYDLESISPRGNWFQTVEAVSVGSQ